MKFQDITQQMNYSHGFLFDPYGAALDGYGEQITIQRSIVDNQMLGGQLGFRYFKAKNRFRYSGEMRVFAMGNLQNNTFFTESETQIYDNSTTGIHRSLVSGMNHFEPTTRRRRTNTDATKSLSSASMSAAS